MRKERTAETKEVLHRFYVSVYERVREGGGETNENRSRNGKVAYAVCPLSPIRGIINYNLKDFSS